jgi:hypothetical protein
MMPKVMASPIGIRSRIVAKHNTIDTMPSTSEAIARPFPVRGGGYCCA